MRAIRLILVALALCAIAHADEFDYTPFDDFEDCSAWVKGDPITDTVSYTHLRAHET